MADKTVSVNKSVDVANITPGVAVVTPPLTITQAPDGGFVSNLNQVADSIVKGAQLYYGTQQQVEQAKYEAQIARAQGQNAVQVAKVGLPSPQLMLAAGLGLVALLILSGKK